MKPREFWIYDVPSQVGEGGVIRVTRDKQVKDLGWIEYHVIESTPLTRNAGDLLTALKLIVHDYWQRLPEGEVRKLEKLITKAEGGDE